MKNFVIKNIVFIAICIVSLSISFYRIPEFKVEKTCQSDVLEYYIYFPAYFIYCSGDIEQMKKNPDTWVYSWTRTSPIGKPVFKFTMGVALLSSPFYITANAWCLANDDYKANGFEKPYIVAMLFATVFYLLLGLFFIRKILVLYFKPIVADIVLLLFFGATNLAFYSFFLIGMSHTFSLAMIAMYVYYTIKWKESQKIKYLVFIGALIGMIFLIRPVNIIFATFFVLYGINSFKEFFTNIISLLKNKWFYLLPLSAVLIAFPQFLYWKVQTGSWYFYSYFDEGFFFRDPKIIEVFLSFKSGLLIYSPILVLAIAGLFKLRKRLNGFPAAVTGTFLVFTYVVSSWWCWWYVGYGHRAFIDLFPVFAFPFAVMIEKITDLKWLYKGPVAAVIAFLVFLSVFQTLQHSRGLLHFDGMNKKAYFKSFLNMQPGYDYYNSLHSPDYMMANKGFREDVNYKDFFDFEIKNTNGFEFDGNWTYNAPRHFGFAHNSQFSQHLDSLNKFSASFSSKIENIVNTFPDSIVLYTWFYPEENINTSIFVFNILDRDSSIVYETRPLSPYKVKPGTWQYTREVFKWPDNAKKEYVLKMYIWNPQNSKLFIDDFGFSLLF